MGRTDGAGGGPRAAARHRRGGGTGADAASRPACQRGQRPAPGADAQIRPIACFARGPRNLTANRTITTPDDLDGLRVPNVPLFVDTGQALGAQPTPMAFGEVFTSLQAGTIDAQDNPLALIRSPRSCSPTSLS